MEALRWWIRVGVTDALGEAPRDRFAGGLPSVQDRSIPPKASVSMNPAPAARGTPGRATAHVPGTQSPDEGERSARALAEAAADLEALRSAMADFEGCALKRTATQLVFADGVPGSRIMFVGEAPGGDEDRIGCPFVGRAGQLLDRMLNSIGFDRQNVYIANVVPWRPPGNRTPTLQETQMCLPFIERQIQLASPEYLVCLGGSAVRTLLRIEGGVMRTRGSWFAYPRESARQIPALAMLHPAFLLRQPAHKRFAWADMRALGRALQP
jgi:uracil-DNA glycosylase family 4